mmetsp:Transcript_30288/g.35742  ORF Transcript_30288/g.35742 Transcript_30288/m.35742 type:complete len:126 (+) Transcript_30288:389-766(+)
MPPIRNTAVIDNDAPSTASLVEDEDEGDEPSDTTGEDVGCGIGCGVDMVVEVEVTITVVPKLELRAVSKLDPEIKYSNVSVRDASDEDPDSLKDDTTKQITRYSEDDRMTRRVVLVEDDVEVRVN